MRTARPNGINVPRYARSTTSHIGCFRRAVTVRSTARLYSAQYSRLPTSVSPEGKRAVVPPPPAHIP
jgi:hypothetical protein